MNIKRKNVQRPQNCSVQTSRVPNFRASNAGFGAKSDFIGCGHTVVGERKLHIRSVIDSGRLFPCAGTILFVLTPVYAVELYCSSVLIFPLYFCYGFHLEPRNGNAGP